MGSLDSSLGGEGAINRFRLRGDAEAMDERGGHFKFEVYIQLPSTPELLNKLANQSNQQPSCKSVP